MERDIYIYLHGEPLLLFYSHLTFLETTSIMQQAFHTACVMWLIIDLSNESDIFLDTGMSEVADKCWKCGWLPAQT